jgi:formylglycine-generating enzyme required for sulfatase activity
MNDDPQEPFAALAVARFVERWVADRAAGRVAPLLEYLSAFPEASTAVARCFAELEALPETAGPPTEAAPATAAEGAADASEFGPYRLLREIGRGGQAIVYLAEDRRFGRRAAVKVIENGGPFFEAAANRLRREAAIVARLDHPALCAVFDVGFSRGRGYVAMRYVEGETYAARLKRRAADPAPPSRAEIRAAATFVASAARALHAAHEAGVVHRDVKPGNLMVGPDGAPVVLDFGLAHDASSEGATLTATGDVFGTPAYMSPEQAAGAAGAPDRRLDVWALGVVLYEAVALRRPFEEPTRAALMDAIRNREPTAVRRRNPAVGRDLAVVVETALAKEPARRYATAADLAEDLERALRGEPVRARRVGPLGRAWRFARRNPVVAALSASLVVGVAAFAWVVSAQNAELSAQVEETVRLGDVKLVQDLAAWDDRLWPVAPDLPHGPTGLDAWLDVAAAALARRPLHRAALERLGTAESRSTEFVPGSATGRDVDVAWRRELLSEHLRRLDALEGRIDGARRRRAECETIGPRSLEEPRAAWDRAAAEIRADNRFSGVRLGPQVGLVPLGRDPVSGLQEFADLRTGEVPRRDAATGALDHGPAHGFVYVLVPGGTFAMGALPPDDEHEVGEPNVDPFAGRFEAPVRSVRLAPYFIAKYETTDAQWLRIAPETERRPRDGFEARERFPACLMSWNAATEALRRVGAELPTEAQWEYAARAGTTSTWWCGTETASLDGAANVADRAAGERGLSGACVELFDRFAGVAPVGSFRANPFGLHDVYGNVAEWCRDELLTYDAKTRAGDGFRPGQGVQPRVVRGGSFESNPRTATSATRGAARATQSTLAFGFRASRRAD